MNCRISAATNVRNLVTQNARLNGEVRRLSRLVDELVQGCDHRDSLLETAVLMISVAAEFAGPERDPDVELYLDHVREVLGGDVERKGRHCMCHGWHVTRIEPLERKDTG